MNDISPLSDTSEAFFKALFQKTDGDISRQISMYDVGQNAGIDKPSTARIAEELMSLGVIDIRTLSGGIGLTEEGAAEGHRRFTENSGGNGECITLGNHPVISEAIRSALEEMLASIRLQMGTSGLDFNDLAELLADIRTIDAQLASTKPKTAIIRECLTSISPTLGRCPDPRLASRVNILLSR